MKLKVCGLWSIGKVMTKLDNVVREMLFLAPGETVSIIGPGESRNLYDYLINFFSVEMIDYDIRFRDDNNIICKDIVFDEYEPGEIIVNYACEKMWPLGKLFKDREFILIGDDEGHNGDCNPITSCEQLVEQNNIVEVYDTRIIKRWQGQYYIVHGIN